MNLKKKKKQKNCKKTFCWWNGSNNADDQASVLFGICDMTSVLLVNHSAHTAWQNLSSWQRKQWGCTHWRQPLPHTTKPMLVHYSQRWICTISDPFLSWYKLEEQYIYSLLIIYWYFYGQHFKISVEYCPLIINKIIYMYKKNRDGIHLVSEQTCNTVHTHTHIHTCYYRPTAIWPVDRFWQLGTQYHIQRFIFRALIFMGLIRALCGNM